MRRVRTSARKRGRRAHPKGARGLALALLGVLAVSGWSTPLAAQSRPTPDYWVYVANESSDLVSLVRFGPGGLVEEKTIPVGIMPADLDGAHGITVSPSGEHWYLTLAHGTPFGRIWKFATGTDELVDTASVGLFPATMALTPDGSMLFGVNFNLHGDPVPSTVSVLFTPLLQEIKQIETCVKPHGGTVNPAGTVYYSVCVGSDQLVEISTATLDVSRRMILAQGIEGPLGPAGPRPSREHPPCKPTWVVVSPNGAKLYVPCNGRAEVLEIDQTDLRITRRFATGRGPYNAAVSPDGRSLVVTLKGDQAIAVFDLGSGREQRITTSQPITHGVAISPDSRYAFVTNEAIGAVRGTVDVFDLHSLTRAATVPVHHQPGGIGFWRMVSPSAEASR